MTSFCFVTLRHANLFVRRSNEKQKWLIYQLLAECRFRREPRGERRERRTGTKWLRSQSLSFRKIKTKQGDVDLSTSFCFVTLRHANLFVGRSGMKTKVVDLSAYSWYRGLTAATLCFASSGYGNKTNNENHKCDTCNKEQRVSRASTATLYSLSQMPPKVAFSLLVLFLRAVDEA